MVEIRWNVAQVKEGTNKILCSPDVVRAECCDMATMAQECMVVITLNAQNKMIDRHMVSLGLVNASMVHPREVFRPAIADGAVSIIVCHNHPSGETTASPEDLRVTRQLVEAGRVVGIRVMDHVIIGREGEGRKGYCSLRETGLATFDGV